MWTFGQTRWQNRFDKVERDPGDDGGVSSFSNEFDTDSGAEEAKGGVRLAMVARAEMIHPQKLGVIVALSRGLVSNIFTSEVEARAWLAS